MNRGLISFLLSLGIHAAILLIGGSLLIHQAEYKVQQSVALTEVELVAAPATEKASPREVHIETQDPEEMVLPKQHKQKPVQKPMPTLTPAPAPSAPVTSASPAAMHASQGGSSSAKPDYLRNPPPRYPESAREARQEGVVLLSVEVSENGEALSVEVMQTSGYQVLDTAAVEAVKGWKFKAATAAGVPIKSRVEVPVRFRLERR